MSATSTRLAEAPVWTARIFDRILCGIEGSESGRVAARQSARLLLWRGTLQLASVVDVSGVPPGSAEARREIERRYAVARRELALCPEAQTRVLLGNPATALAAAAREFQATLVAVGRSQRGRREDVVPDSVGARLLHDAPCSVLVARPVPDEAAFPRSIVVGHDGSRGAAEAVAVARELAQRFSADLHVLAATGGAPVVGERLEAESSLTWSSLAPADALTAASDEVDLVVVGSRGLPGPRAPGSVSERVAQLARSSVLVVREPAALVAAREAVPDEEC